MKIQRYLISIEVISVISCLTSLGSRTRTDTNLRVCCVCFSGGGSHSRRRRGVNSSHFLSPHCFLCVVSLPRHRRQGENERGETTKSTMHNACLDRGQTGEKRSRNKGKRSRIKCVNTLVLFEVYRSLRFAGLSTPLPMKASFFIRDGIPLPPCLDQKKCLNRDTSTYVMSKLFIFSGPELLLSPTHVMSDKKTQVFIGE